MFKLKKKTLKCFINFLEVLEVRPSVHCMVRQIPGLSLLFQPLDVINLISNHALNSLLGHFFHSKAIYDRKFSGSNFCFLHLIDAEDAILATSINTSEFYPFFPIPPMTLLLSLMSPDLFHVHVPWEHSGCCSCSRRLITVLSRQYSRITLPTPSLLLSAPQ